MMADAAKVLDENRLEARARLGDILALGLLVVVGSLLLFNMYQIGYSASQAAGDLNTVFARDAAFTRGIIEAAIVALAIAWIVYRLFSRSARRSGGMG